MAGEWETFRLGELGKIVTGKTPSKKVAGAFGGETPFVTPRDMDGCRLIESTERKLSQSGVQSVRGSIIPANSVAVSCIGSDMGKAVIILEESITNQQINTIVVSDKFDFNYVYYNLSDRKDEIRGAAGGSAQPILNKTHFSQLEINIPPLPEQKAIAHVLGSLDDKIELNRRMNETLEGMAQALFKSWFVDFEPATPSPNPSPSGRKPVAKR
jgi:type I restriction enzyme S subunit